jgi:hypothetical protein
VKPENIVACGTKDNTVAETTKDIIEAGGTRTIL